MRALARQVVDIDFHESIAKNHNATTTFLRAIAIRYFRRSQPHVQLAITFFGCSFEKSFERSQRHGPNERPATLSIDLPPTVFWP